MRSSIADKNAKIRIFSDFGALLVEKLPGEAVEEAEGGAGVVGEGEVVGFAFEEAVEVAGFEVDAGAFDLEVDEEVGVEAKIGRASCRERV